MKTVAPILVFLFAFALPASTQTLKQLEKKAHKTFKKEAFGMALYYSQAILTLDSSHTDAQHWAAQASEKLHLSDKPNSFHAGPNPQILPEGFLEKEPQEPAALIPLVVATFNALDSSALYGTYIGITNDGFGKGDFLENRQTENRAVFQIPKGEFFTITGTKNKFSSGTSTLSTADLSGRDTLFCQLYLSPSWGLPISLYFDEGKPNALHPADSTTNMTYEAAWLDYLYRIDEYIDSNTVSESMADKAKAQAEVGLFFANDVDANFHKLKPLCEMLVGYLKAGEKITLALEGYTSQGQVAQDGALPARRMHSIENFFSFYENGLLKPWLASGDLKIKRLYVIKNEVGETIDRRSVFDLGVAKSRKVVVKMVDRE